MYSPGGGGAPHDNDHGRLAKLLFPVPLTPRDTSPFTAASHSFEYHLGNYGIKGVYLSGIEGSVFFNTAQSNVNFYTVTAFVIDTTGASTTLTLTTPTTAPYPNPNLDTTAGATTTKPYTTATSWRPFNINLDVVFGNTFHQLGMTWTPTAAPGTFFMNATLLYRPVF